MTIPVIRLIAILAISLPYIAIANSDKLISDQSDSVKQSEDSMEHQSEDASDAADASESSSSVEESNDESKVHVVDQINKTFSKTSITVGVGDVIEFTNSDSYFHNIYSLSPAAQFDLGSYPKGESRSVKLENAGEVLAKCAIHPQMEIAITVEENNGSKLANTEDEN